MEINKQVNLYSYKFHSEIIRYDFNCLKFKIYRYTNNLLLKHNFSKINFF